VGPNLLDQLQTATSRSLGYQLCRILWPVAAVVLVAVGLCVANLHEYSKCGELTHQLEQLDAQTAGLRQLRMDIRRADAKIEHLRTIDDGILLPPWNEVLATVGQCMPEGVWLEKVTANGKGVVSLAGNSLDDQSIFQLAHHLEPSPMMSRVVIEQTQAIEGKNGWVTKFDIQLKLDDQAGGSKE
jgi:Tfp pilus assembly protein PilN